MFYPHPLASHRRLDLCPLLRRLVFVGLRGVRARQIGREDRDRLKGRTPDGGYSLHIEMPVRQELSAKCIHYLLVSESCFLRSDLHVRKWHFLVGYALL